MEHEPDEHLDAVPAARSALERSAGTPLAPRIEAAIALATRGHEGQVRRSGEPYLIHPLYVGALLAESGWDVATVAAGICHDLLEDTEISYEEVASSIGEDAAHLVQGVTRMDQVRTGPDAEAADVQRLLAAVAGDVRVLAVKLADRLHNIRTLEHLPENKQRKVARQTLELLAPLGHRIGAYEWARELEDTAFSYLDPESSQWLDAELASGAQARLELEDLAAARIGAALARTGIEAQITSRTKGRWSLWRKLQRVGSLAQVWDLVGLRVLVNDPAACYAAVGMVHSCYSPMPGRFKDYIALPKPNGYRALHTTVTDERGNHFEVQIRDTEMDRTAVHGPAAHYLYKRGESRPLVATEAAGLGAEEFLDELHDELASVDHVLTLTPAGKVIALPAGACAIDFAYAVHTEVGHRCVGAKVNGVLVPIREPLNTGDVVEILTRKDGTPSRDWLDSVVSAGARTRIRRYFSGQDREANEKAGRLIWEKALRERHLPVADTPVPVIAQAFGRARVDNMPELLRLLGTGKIDIKRLFEDAAEPKRAVVREPALRSGGIAVEGLAGMRSQVAQCCHPKAGDDLVGYVSVGRGVVLHRRDCHNVEAMRRNARVEDRGRFLDLFSEQASRVFVITAADREGLLADVGRAFAALGVNITSSQTRSRDRGVEQRFYVTDPGPELEAALLELLREVPSVLSARAEPHD